MRFICAFFFYIFVLPFSSLLHIGHTIEEQLNWHKLSEGYGKCAFGFYQTPIHVEDHHVEHIFMPALDFTGYRNFLQPPLTIHNNGHTVKVSLGDYGWNGLYNAPSISGGLLSSAYILDSLHFHWGKTNNEGSEHVINNVRYPMEMHLVHRNVGYNTTSEALKHKDGIAVLAFFFHMRVRDNQKLKYIVRNLRHVKGMNEKVKVERTFTLNTLLPRELDQFFTYEGSLTTPPCSEAVTWFLFPETIPISFHQMDLFRSLQIHNNFRMLQEVGQRKIFLRRNDRFVKHDIERYDRHNITSRSFWLY